MRRPVAYVEAEYFGNIGIQCVQVRYPGAVVLSPLHLGEGEAILADGSLIS